MLYASQMETVSLRSRIDELQQHVTHLQSANNLAEQRTSSNWDQLIIEREKLTKSLQEQENLKVLIVSMEVKQRESDEERSHLLTKMKAAQDENRKEV